jgi:DhnA family fructose-bisphosphate aldolase class Ia
MQTILVPKQRGTSSMNGETRPAGQPLTKLTAAVPDSRPASTYVTRFRTDVNPPKTKFAQVAQIRRQNLCQNRWYDARPEGDLPMTLADGDRHHPKRRLHHIFARDGRAVIVAMDGARSGPARGLENPRQAVRNVVAGGADAILTTPGMAKATADQLHGQGLIIGLDADDDTSDYGVEAALRAGADAVELKVFPGNPHQSKIDHLRRLSARCDQWNVPLLGEPIPVSFQDTSAHTLANIAQASRIGAEIGCDFLKVHYAGTVAQYASEVIAPLAIPVLCLGGPAKPDPRDALQLCFDAIAAGASGIVFGRNIVTADRPDRMCSALGAIVHGGATVDQALKELAVPH